MAYSCKIFNIISFTFWKFQQSCRNWRASEGCRQSCRTTP